MLSDRTIKRMRRVGLTPQQIISYENAFNEMREELNGKVFLLFTIIADNVLTEDEYNFSFDKINAFNAELLNLLDAIRNGTTKWQECADLFKEITGGEVDFGLLAEAGVNVKDCVRKEQK